MVQLQVCEKLFICECNCGAGWTYCGCQDDELTKFLKCCRRTHQDPERPSLLWMLYWGLHQCEVSGGPLTQEVSVCWTYLVSCVLQQFGCCESGHSSPNNDHMMRAVDVWKTFLDRLQQLVVVFVLQTVTQMFLQPEGRHEAAAQNQQQQTEANCSYDEGKLFQNHIRV